MSGPRTHLREEDVMNGGDGAVQQLGEHAQHLVRRRARVDGGLGLVVVQRQQQLRLQRLRLRSRNRNCNDSQASVTGKTNIILAPAAPLPAVPKRELRCQLAVW